MLRSLIRLIPGLVFIMAACSSDASTGPNDSAPKYESIAGTYNGSMIGLSQGVGLSAVFSMTVNQTGGTASGSWGISGTLGDGVSTLQVSGTGMLSGSIAQGTNPSVNLTIHTGACPNYSATFSGAYDSANKRITLTGPVDFFAANSCTVALTYNMTFILTR